MSPPAALTATPAPQFERPGWLATATVAEYGRLLRSARRPPAEVARDQRRRLRAMVSHARRQVPLYGRLYAELGDDDAPTVRRLPLVDKQTFVLATSEERTAGSPTELGRSLETSGTSGHPLTVDWSPRFAWWQGALLLRMARLQGVGPAHRRVRLTFLPDTRPVGGLFGMIRGRHVSLCTDDSPATLARAIEALRPDVLSGHGHMAVEIGEALAGSWRPRLVNPVGEQLTDENRSALARTFGSEPLDVYSSCEFGVVAWQCEAADLYHINHESVLVEVLGADGEPLPPGTLGELVISGLGNPLMPFLRYRTGDSGVLAERPCRCGSELPALELVQGRMLDWLLDDRGQRVAPQRLWLSEHVGGGISLVRRYQIRQSRSGRVRILLVPRIEISAQRLRQLEASYQGVLGRGIQIDVVLVDQLESEPSGKFRVVVRDESDPGETRPA